jgi:hypothetical protein
MPMAQDGLSDTGLRTGDPLPADYDRLVTANDRVAKSTNVMSGATVFVAFATMWAASASVLAAFATVFLGWQTMIVAGKMDTSTRQFEEALKELRELNESSADQSQSVARIGEAAGVALEQADAALTAAPLVVSVENCTLDDALPRITLLLPASCHELKVTVHNPGRVPVRVAGELVPVEYGLAACASDGDIEVPALKNGELWFKFPECLQAWSRRTIVQAPLRLVVELNSSKGN